MRDKAEKRRNDYLKAKKKERIFDYKNKEEEGKNTRGFFGKLKKGKIPDTRSPEDIENEIDSPKRSDKRREDKMNSQLEDYYKDLLEDK